MKCGINHSTPPIVGIYARMEVYHWLDAPSLRVGGVACAEFRWGAGFLGKVFIFLVVSVACAWYMRVTECARMGSLWGVDACVPLRA